MRYFVNKLSILIFFGFSACSLTPGHIKSFHNDKLQKIHQSYVDTVKQANRDLNRHWQHGRLGNMTVNLDGSPNVGLCYHWQEIVYVGIQPAIKKTGWRAVGIAINEGNFLEHHAVLVYDPQQVEFEKILKTQYQSNSYVLDPWKTGKPRIYSLKNWLALPFSIEKPARLTTVANFRLTGYKP